ncbi:SPOR domain-containing protein [Paracoccus sp. S-4012]|uniref:SPOR domain-containing protein n=1 Tax=Paracoccus sp. S-4012 TaxID=2665648 RepID=UPI0012B0A977|nr:SPOR domain-containing protein [Paracoccus sp. S-4012]MRX50806.1 SPOR domain-containing protein [Paracoccus sp. S-4012]
MTVIDFRSGGYDDGYGEQGYAQGHAAWEAQDDARYPQDRDDLHRYATDPAPAGLSFAGRVARLLNYLGALVSVALMVGLAVWGYRLVTRDVSGVPVIVALEGEARVAPENPGGDMGDGKGLAVNAVAAGTGPAEVGQVAIAPPSASLTDEDVAMGELGATERAPGVLSELAPEAPFTPVVALADAEAARLAAEAEAEAVALTETAPIDADETGALALLGPDGEPLTETPTQAEAIELAVAEAATPVVAASPRPVPRPMRMTRVASADPAVALAASTPPPPPAAAAEPAPAAAPAAAPVIRQSDLPSGAMVVQIGAFDSDAIARSEWDRVAGRNGGLFSGKSQLVQQTEKGGRTFWRLRVAGFDTPADARGFCESLKAAGTDCIPTQAN